MSIQDLLALLSWFLSIGDTADAATTQDEIDRVKGPIGG